MKTLQNIIDSVAAESFPGTSFSNDLKSHATQLLDRDISRTANKALRKAILTYRPDAISAAVLKSPIRVNPAQPTLAKTL